MFIALKLYSPEGTFVLENKLAFNKIKLTDATMTTNGITGVDNVLVWVEKYNSNQFIIQTADSNTATTNFLSSIPIVQSTPFNFSPVAIDPPDYYNNEVQNTRYLKFRILKNDGNLLSATEWNGSVLQLKFNFE